MTRQQGPPGEISRLLLPQGLASKTASLSEKQQPPPGCSPRELLGLGVHLAEGPGYI